MYFRKYKHPANFDFDANYSEKSGLKVGKQKIDVEVKECAGDIYYVKMKSANWKKNYSQSKLDFKKAKDNSTSLSVNKSLGLKLKDSKGATILESLRGKEFGISGDSSMFIFKHNADHQYYGLGEKCFSELEHTGRTTKFWNTDVMGDFAHDEYTNGNIDPSYASVPYVIIKRNNTYVGILIDNPYATFMSLSAGGEVEGAMVDNTKDMVMVGTEDGQPNIVIIYGPTLAELTRKLQTVVGRTPLPPVWSLGFNQCRWGYKGEKDLKWLDENMRKNKIPCDGLWLDIDYMDGYRVYTFNNKYFKNIKKTLGDLNKKGRKVIPIIDPGVKDDKKYDVFKSGMKKDVFCKNPQGKIYVGLVWPGRTAFPDFSMAKTRKWWAEYVRKFAENGFYGCWNDMNDPSTGSVLCTDMLFNNGKDSHYTYHNQYATGMAKATRDGFLAAHPDKRPFILSRSAFTGSSRYSAVWTGDNMSNYHHLKMSIPCTLNLALSGIPFNGPDVGGFGANCSGELMLAWQKAGFLFPFLRNHSCAGTEHQEPWQFGKKICGIVRDYIQLRYRLRPYLYNLYVDQENSGEAIMRPLFYDFADTKKLPLGNINDQFMLGPYIMHAPVVEEKAKSRKVVLPGKQKWYSAMDGKWLASNRTITVKTKDDQTPLYFLEGGIVPVSRAAEGDNKFEARKVDFHLFMHKTAKISEYTYSADDGETFEYKAGKRTVMKVTAEVKKGVLNITTKLTKDGFGKVNAGFMIYDKFKEVTVNGKSVKPKAAKFKMAGCTHGVWKV